MNLPSNVRAALYVITAIGSPLVAYLGQQGVIGTFWVGLWAVVVTAVASLARINVGDK